MSSRASVRSDRASSILSHESWKAIDKTATSIRQFPSLIQLNTTKSIASNIPPLLDNVKRGGTLLYRLDCEVLDLLIASAAKTKVEHGRHVLTINIIQPFEYWIDAHLSRLETWGSEVSAEEAILDVIAHNDDSEDGLNSTVTACLLEMYESLSAAGIGMDVLIHHLGRIATGRQSHSRNRLEFAQSNLRLALEQVDTQITQLYGLITSIRAFAAFHQRSGPYTAVLDKIRMIDENHPSSYSLPPSRSSFLTEPPAIQSDGDGDVLSAAEPYIDLKQRSSLEQLLGTARKKESPVIAEKIETAPSTPSSELPMQSELHIEPGHSNTNDQPLSHGGNLASDPVNDHIDELEFRSFVLSLDGGGVRCFSTLLILKHLMKTVEQLENNCDDPAESSFHPLVPPRRAIKPQVYLPCHYFDYVAGVSTGGLLAIMLGRLRMSVDESLDAFAKVFGQVFGRPRLFSILGYPQAKYSASRLGSSIRGVLAAQVQDGAQMFSDPNCCKTMVLATRENKDATISSFIFRSYPMMSKSFEEDDYDPRVRDPDHISKIPIENVARASVAAPFFSKSVKIGDRDYSDGATLSGNNCGDEAWFEVCKNHRSSSAIGLMVSIGAGGKNRALIGQFAKKKGVLGSMSRMRAAWASMKSNLTDTERIHEILTLLSEANNTPYFRLNCGGDMNSIRLSGWKISWSYQKGTLDSIQSIVDKYVLQETVQDELQRIAASLVQNRRRRSKTSDWERFATGGSPEDRK